MRLTEKALSQRKETILHTAYTLFCAHGVDGVTLTEIAKASNVGTSAIYRYFSTKANLLWHTQKILWEEIVEQLHTETEEMMQRVRTGFEELTVIFERFQALYRKHSSYLLFALDYKMYLVRGGLTLSKEEHDRFLAPVLQVMQTALRRGHIDGSIRSDETAEEQCIILWNLLYGYVEQAAMYEHIFEEDNAWEEKLTLIYRHILNSLRQDRAEEPVLE